MPDKCCMPNCSSNYDNTKNAYVSVFAFPKDDETRQKWIKCVHRESFVPTKHSVVCIKHFSESSVIKVDKMTRDDGSILEVPRKRPKLTKGAVPSIFPNLPSYMTKKSPVKRKHPDERRQELANRDESVFQEWVRDDNILNFDNFLLKFKEKNLLDFLFKISESFISFLKIDCDSDVCPTIVSGFKIFKDLKVVIFCNNNVIPPSKFSWLLGNDSVCSKWSQFDCLLSHVNSNISKVVDGIESIKVACKRLEKSINSLLDDNIANESFSLKKISFIKDQLTLALTRRPQYSAELMLWASSIFFQFPGGYNKLRNSEVLTIPHPDYLKRITADIKSDTGIKKQQIEYFVKKYQHLEEHEKTINILFDEIYVTPKVEYKGGHLIGSTEHKEVATKIQAFMLSSVFSKNEDIVALYPVKQSSAVDLREMILNIIKILTKIGFRIVSLISDNHRMNRSCFRLLSNTTTREDLPCFIHNPFDVQQRIYLLFDTVHLFKSIRNNWLNQKNRERSFVFPHFDNYNLLLYANLSDLEKIYAKECNQIVKLAPALSRKVLNPSTLERQNVQLAVRLFDEKNIQALNQCSDIDTNGTSEFLTIILHWWRIVNVRSPKSGYHQRDPFRDPIRESSDKNVEFLSRFYDFLCSWEALQLEGLKEHHSGKLTNDTCFALKHTTKSLVNLVQYLFETFEIKYVLLGKFQTDKLEGRFGKYRQMSGSHFHISVTQVLESEKKLKILSLLKLKSSKFGTFSLKEFSFSDKDENDSSSAQLSQNISVFSEIIHKPFNSQVDSAILSSLFYISGYCAHSIIKFVNGCENCLIHITSNSDFSINFTDCESNSAQVSEYLKNLSRGALKQPSELLFEVSIQAYQIFNELISDEYEAEFLKTGRQRIILRELIISNLEQHIEEINEKCILCNKTLMSILTRASHIISNIFLNNYSKIINNEVYSKNRDQSNRKLLKFHS